MAFEEQQPFDPASFEHIPVLLNECLTGLAIDPAGTYLDGTAGGAAFPSGRAACHRGADQFPLCGAGAGAAGH